MKDFKFHPDVVRLHKIGKVIFDIDGELPVLDRGTEPWRAWRQWREERDIPVGIMDRQERWTVVSAWPPHDLDEFEREITARKKGGGLSGDALKRLGG